MLNVCRKDNLGSRSDRWFHHVYLAILLFLINCDPLGKDPLLQEAVEDEEGRIYDKDSESLKRRRH